MTHLARPALAGSAFASFLLVAMLAAITDASQAATTVKTVEYHGWPDSLVMSNGKVDLVIVPAIGRVMQFKFAGAADGPFWENRALDGKSPDPKAKEWGNFGGDKTWPSPQADWPNVATRGWPPPPAFDSMPVDVKMEAGVVTLVSAVDPFYGIRTQRRIELEPDQPVMRITTIYEKVSGAPQKVGVWVITQLKDPQGAFAAVPSPSLFAQGYNKQSDELPLDLKATKEMLSMRRHTKTSHKVGGDGGALVWVGAGECLLIESARVAGAEYPDQGSSAEIYTNPDPLAYVELELLGPLQTLSPGQKMERDSRYTLFRRSRMTPPNEARRILRGAGVAAPGKK